MAVKPTLADATGEAGLLCMTNVATCRTQNKEIYRIPLCFTRATELIRNSPEELQKIFEPYNLVLASATGSSRIYRSSILKSDVSE